MRGNGETTVDIIELEKRIIQQLHELPIESAEEVLDFALFLKQRKGAVKSRQRPLGLLKGKASYRMEDDFTMTDEELLGQ